MEEDEQIRVPLMKSSAVPAASASLNNDHNSDLHACCVSVRSSSRPNIVPAKPLCPQNATWWFSLVANLSNIVLGCAPAAKVDAHVVASLCRVAVTTLAPSLIWPCNNFVLSCYISSCFVSPSLTSKLVRRRLSLRSSCLGMLTKVSTARLTT
jgi:hypothetical protein